jgi:two-component system OmpR family sensor kinase
VSLRLRLALFGAAVVALALLVFGALLYGLLARNVTSTQDTAIRNRAQQAASAAESSDLTPRPPIAPADLRVSTDLFVEVFDLAGSTVYSTAVLDGQPPSLPPDALSAARARDGVFATEGDPRNGTQVRVYVLPFSHGFVVAGQSTRVPASNLSGVVAFLIISAVPALLAALAASWLVAGRALRPLREVATAADEIGRARDFSRRLETRHSRDEVARLSASFNSMLGALQDAYGSLGAALEAQRRFVADASHELRTPLATIQGNAGLLAHGPNLSDEVRRAAAADIAAESDRMARLTDRLLTLARADSGLSLVLAPVELRPLVAEVVRQAAAIHPDKALTGESAELSVAGDPDALRQLLWNLLENAARHARSSVTVTVGEVAGWARLAVGDDGPGVPIEERERIFERFYRTDYSRTGRGTGLGLAIARWIVEQHGGRILAAEGSAGGATFYVDLPLLRGS